MDEADADLEAIMNVMFAIPPGNGGEPEGDGTRMIDNPNDEMKDGFASMRDCKVDVASGDQYSDNVMGILGETLTFENFSIPSDDIGASEGSENVHVSNML